MGPSSQTRGKRPGKHDRSTDGENEGNDEEDDNDDDEEDFSPRAKLPKVHEDGGNGAKLACPFFKHNPRKYKNQRPCCGPGWDHVHRIKYAAFPPEREHWPLTSHQGTHISQALASQVLVPALLSAV